jgi:Tfp pilus assembly protein PilN
MATTMVPPTPSPKPAPADARYVAVRAHLLPDEIISGRQTEVVRKQVLVALGLVAVLLVGWFALSWWQTRSANGDLGAAQAQGASLQQEQRQFAPLVTAITNTANINGQLQNLMVGDLSWNAMLTTIRQKAPSGVVLTSVDGKITSGAAASSGTPPPDSSVLNATGKATVGSLTLMGVAPDKRSIATYADQLATVPGLTAPLISSVQGSAHAVSFTVEVVITSDALTPPAPTTGGN